MIASLRAHTGATIVEVVMTIAIVALLMVAAMPTMLDWLHNVRIRTAAEAAKDGLQLARSEAVRRNSNVEFVLGLGTAWTVRLAATGEIIQSHPVAEGTADVIVTPTPADATTVTFDGLGRRGASNADASNVLTRVEVDLPATILPADRTRDLRLDIGLGGQLRLCDPNVSDSADTRYCA